MEPHKIVSEAEWLEASRALLAKEKEFTRARDALSAERRKLPWVKVSKKYVFDTEQGKKTLAELFGSDLIDRRPKKVVGALRVLGFGGA